MVGKKGYKYSENQIVEVAKNTADNVENSEFILDLDELHVNVSPPSELNENCSPKTEDKRKKVRHHRHILNFAVDTQQANNKCHQCRRKNLKYGLFKCSRKECSILYCAICIKKYNQQFNTCFYCQRVCKCKVCRNKFDNHNKNDDLSEEDDYFSFDEKNMVKIDDFIVIEQKDSEFDNDEIVKIDEELKKKAKIKVRKNFKKEFKNKKADEAIAKNGNNIDADNKKKNKTKKNSNEKELKISFDDGINLNEEKIKNKNSYKIKNMKGELSSDNHHLTDKGSEKINSDNLDKENSSGINALKDNFKPETTDIFKDNSLLLEKLNDKISKDNKLYKINNKNKIKKNESFNLNANNLNQSNNSNNNSNKKEKLKKEKTEKLEKMEKAESKNEGETNNTANNDCIRNIEIPSYNYIKSKKSVYKNCLYCKNDKINIMTILRFKSSEEFIFYSKHFYEKLSDENLKIYKESKNNFERYYNDYYKKCSQSNNFTFKSIKYICMSCFEENLKDDNGFSNILNTLQYGLNPTENKIPAGKTEENNNNNNISNSILNENCLNENKTLNMEPNIDLNFNSGEKIELLKQKKKYIKKKLKNNVEEEKVQINSNTPVNLINPAINLESNIDKDIINNLINYNKIKKMQTNENSNIVASNNNSINNNPLNTNQKAQNNNNNSSNNYSFPPNTGNNPITLQNINSQTIGNSANQNPIYSQENNNNVNNLINSSNATINKNSVPNSQNKNSNQNKTQNEVNQNNSNNNYTQNNSNLNFNTINTTNVTQNLSNANKNQAANNQNQNTNNSNIINNYQNQTLNENLNSNTDTKLDNLNNLISQGIDELYNTTKENLGNLNDGGMNVTNIIMNFEQNKEDLSYKLNLRVILDDLKKQFFSINYYSLLQKLFMSYIFKNLETFVEQISKNQYLGDFIINSIIQTIPKLQDSNEIKNNPNSLEINNLINNINDQINSLRNTNNQGQLLTTSLNGVFDELKLNGNKIFESIEAGNKLSNMDANNPFNISNMNLDSNNFDMLIKNAAKRQNNQNGNMINSTNISQNLISNNLNNTQQLFGGLNANDILQNDNNNQSQIQNEIAKNNLNKRDNSNNHAHYSEISQNNFTNNQNKNASNYSNEMANLLNSSNKNMESKEKIQSNLNDSLTHNILLHNNLSSNLEKDVRLQNPNNNQNQNLNNLINNNNSLIQNMMGMGSIVNANQISFQNSSNPLQTNMTSPLNLTNPQNQQMQMLEKIINQKNNNANNYNKLNQQQQLNMIPDLASISMLSQGAANNNLNLMGNYIPNLHKQQNAGNMANLNPLLGMNSLPLNIHSLNHPSLNNQLLQQQQQNLQFLNVNNQLLPMQLGGMQYINPLTQSINVDLLNKLQGGVGLNNLQGINGMLANQQMGLMNGMNLNHRLLLEGNNQQNLLNPSMLNSLDVNLQALKKFNNNNNENE